MAPGFGTAVVLWQRNTSLFAAVSAPALHRVYVFDLSSTPTIVGCAREDSDFNFGASLAVGDVDHDGRSDLIVATPTSTLSGSLQPGRLHAYLDATMQGDLACDSPWPSLVFDCGVSDECKGFARSIAAGDLDNDGTDEIAVGVSEATVNNVTNAGSVWLLRARAQPNLPHFTRIAVLSDSIPQDNAKFGRSVLMGRVGTRDELFVGLPGLNEVRMYQCTGIPGDRPNDPGLNGVCRP